MERRGEQKDGLEKKKRLGGGRIVESWRRQRVGFRKIRWRENEEPQQEAEGWKVERRSLLEAEGGRKEKDGGGVMMRRGKSERERSTLRLYINAWNNKEWGNLRLALRTVSNSRFVPRHTAWPPFLLLYLASQCHQMRSQRRTVNASGRKGGGVFMAGEKKGVGGGVQVKPAFVFLNWWLATIQLHCPHKPTEVFCCVRSCERTCFSLFEISTRKLKHHQLQFKICV